MHLNLPNTLCTRTWFRVIKIKKQNKKKNKKKNNNKKQTTTTKNKTRYIHFDVIQDYLMPPWNTNEP